MFTYNYARFVAVAYGPLEVQPVVIVVVVVVVFWVDQGYGIL